MSYYEQLRIEQAECERIEGDSRRRDTVRAAARATATLLALVLWVYIPGLGVIGVPDRKHATGDDWHHDQPGVVHDTTTVAPPVVIGWL